MKSLIVDIGNSRAKLAVFSNNELLTTLIEDQVSEASIEKLLEQYQDIEQCIVSNVGNQSDSIYKIIKQKIDQTINFDLDLKIPIENLYKTPETLGKDRLAAAVGANFMFPNQDLLIIDAGTAITYEFVNRKNQYLGGYITPGIQTRLNSLNHYTSKLPLLKPEITTDEIGKTTQKAILGGLQQSIRGEFKEVISMFKVENEKITLILTGGNSDYFDKILKNYKFVPLEITLIGLNRLLNYNLAKH